MIDRRRISLGLLVLTALLAAIGTLQPMFSIVYRGFSHRMTVTTTLWNTTSDPADGPPDQPAIFGAGWPVVLAVLVVAASVVLLVRERTAFVGRPLAMGGAGVLAGVVFLYVVLVRELAANISDPQYQSANDNNEVRFHGGFHLLVITAIIGLVGAALAQQRTAPSADEEEDDENEDGVVVHQLGNDDDTPPFGLAIPHDEPQQETR
ncbi:hypothetical protein [Lentzea sp. NBRC 102530]|uniref:hypothetical protein n=1 Tax=Lentzea sp. NBRC 102530 TaxID=3032201 RepID=UPI0024A1E5E6|nr:hypothetical protein [Lentzea sp. NBRC 102530]GLY53181.1 hypothetical protein Lesp01_68370 [Lentzea sp. NBRC 102530]